MSDMLSTIIETVICAAPFIGVPVLCYFDPAGHYEAAKRERAGQ